MEDTVAVDAVTGGGAESPVSVEEAARREAALKGGKLEMKLVPTGTEDSKIWLSADEKIFLAASHTDKGVIVSMENGTSCSIVINGNGIFQVGDCKDLARLCQSYVMKDPYFSERIREYMGY